MALLVVSAPPLIPLRLGLLNDIAFVNLEDMKGSDLNYLIQVKVINEHLEANNLHQIRKIPGIKPSDFMEVYGDSFVSGFIEGGEFTALLSIGVISTNDVPLVKSAVQSDFENLQSVNNASVKHQIQDLLDEGRVSVSIRYLRHSKMVTLLI